MQIGSGAFTYTWHENWARIPDTPSGRNNGRTHGVEVLGDGRVAVFSQAVPGVLFFDRSGQLVEHWGDRFVGAHGMTRATHQGADALWLTDQESCEVVKVSLTGETILRLDPPPLEARPNGNYMPTWAEQNPGNGDIWVADGYGGHALHRYDASGRYRSAYTGFEGVALDQPHGVRFAPDGTLWVTDRGNHRVLVLDGDGGVIRQSSDACHSPCSFAFHEGHTYVAELFGALKVLDTALNVLADLGANPFVAPPSDWAERDKWVSPEAAKREGWPNVAGTDHIQPGRFSSPHGIAVDPQTGDLYVVEWIVGGRIIKLERQS